MSTSNGTKTRTRSRSVGTGQDNGTSPLTPTDVKAQEAEEARVEQTAIKLARIEATTLLVPIRGTSDLIVHRFSEKAKRQMLDAMQGRKSPKEPKDPEAEYQSARYRFRADKDGPENDGMTCIAFKQATVGGARFFDGVTMTALRQSFFVRGTPGVDGLMLTRLSYEARERREDTVKVGRGGSDLRYRPGFRNWSTTLQVTFVRSMIDKDSILSLIDAGGMGVGVGDWRPEKNGDFGTYEVDRDREVEEIS